jgi:hypothetical protein
MDVDKTTNQNYNPTVKFCAVCKLQIDCSALPKVYTHYKGKEIHYHCLEEIIRTYFNTQDF